MWNEFTPSDHQCLSTRIHQGTIQKPTTYKVNMQIRKTTPTPRFITVMHLDNYPRFSNVSSYCISPCLKPQGAIAVYQAQLNSLSQPLRTAECPLSSASNFSHDHPLLVVLYAQMNCPVWYQGGGQWRDSAASPRWNSKCDLVRFHGRAEVTDKLQDSSTMHANKGSECRVEMNLGLAAPVTFCELLWTILYRKSHESRCRYLQWHRWSFLKGTASTFQSTGFNAHFECLHLKTLRGNSRNSNNLHITVTYCRWEDKGWWEHSCQINDDD